MNIIYLTAVRQKEKNVVLKTAFHILQLLGLMLAYVANANQQRYGLPAGRTVCQHLTLIAYISNQVKNVSVHSLASVAISIYTDPSTSSQHYRSNIVDPSNTVD